MSYMIVQTKQQRKNTQEALYKMWPSVPPQNVADHLRYFLSHDPRLHIDCGSVACFGGWVPFWPAFAAQGVGSSKEHGGEPYMLEHGDGLMVDGDEVARHLFGNTSLFWPRDCHPAEMSVRRTDEEEKIARMTDHEIVTNRLKWLLNNSVVIE